MKPRRERVKGLSRPTISEASLGTGMLATPEVVLPLRAPASPPSPAATPPAPGRRTSLRACALTLSADPIGALHECVKSWGGADLDLAVACRRRQERIDQPLHLERIAARHARRPALLERCEKVTPQRQMIVVRKGHGIGTGATGGGISSHRFASSVMVSDGKGGAGKRGGSRAADEVDALGPARVGGSGGLDHADGAALITYGGAGEVLRLHAMHGRAGGVAAHLNDWSRQAQ